VNAVRINRVLIIATTAVLAAGLSAGPASASVPSPSGSTTQTFDVDAGTLDVESPVTADIGGGGPGTVITGQMGPTTVTDGRASADSSWVSTVTSSVFQTGGGTPTETILPGKVDYWSGPATATTGNGTFTPGQSDTGSREPLDSLMPLISFTHTGGTGNNTATWDPTLQINVPLDKQAGVYTGTVTHSVA
jgi:hypothetical protein